MSETQEARADPLPHASDLGTFYTYRPTTPKRVLSGLSLGIAGIFLFAALHGLRVYQGDDALWNLSAGLLYTLATGLPGGYWLAHTLLDTQRVQRWATEQEAYSTNWQWLAENEAHSLTHPLPRLPALPRRRWWAVWLTGATLFVLAASLGNNMSVA
ncbi:hypothetical protein H7347_08020 [Corynebacterium sp. zg-331]|uniref:hypothetical protein n=1 Tax=unclassified Corynebacterium TaxID=2624378 RepID=UPI00128E3A24|nr:MULTISPECIES: hypothetical protein [unclassified Corynebacterium]MBC3186514.1 hypothetical protein [Corynebacterium sp. zg-331]MPV52999.1 hypothetical protein [Corynebacterium sp. zg331]